jgi:hypothetical protein
VPNVQEAGLTPHALTCSAVSIRVWGGGTRADSAVLTSNSRSGVALEELEHGGVRPEPVEQQVD